MQNVVTIFQRCAFMPLWQNNDANYCKISIALNDQRSKRVNAWFRQLTWISLDRTHDLRKNTACGFSY